MIFCQTDFIAFLLIVWCEVWLCHANTTRKGWLLVTSYFFYGYADWKMLPLLIGANKFQEAVYLAELVVAAGNNLSFIIHNSKQDKEWNWSSFR